MAKNQGKYKRKSPKTVTYSTRITEETKKKLEALASLLNKSQAEVFEDLVSMGFDHFTGNPSLA